MRKLTARKVLLFSILLPLSFGCTDQSSRNEPRSPYAPDPGLRRIIQNAQEEADNARRNRRHEVTATELASFYQSDEMGKEFNDSTVVVTGKVKSVIDVPSGAFPTIILNGSKDIDIECRFYETWETAKRLRVGQRTTFECKCKGKDGNSVLLHGCRLTSSR